MKNQPLNIFVLTASVIFALTACESKQMRPYGTRPKTTAQKQSPQLPQLKDECPAADGAWTVAGDTTIEFGRKEGFLSLQHPDLTEPLVMDGQSRKIKNRVTGATPDITASCSKQLILITYVFEGKSVSQSWNIDLEKDIIVITEQEGESRKSIQGLRKYSRAKPAARP